MFGALRARAQHANNHVEANMKIYISFHKSDQGILDMIFVYRFSRYAYMLSKNTSNQLLKRYAQTRATNFWKWLRRAVCSMMMCEIL